MPGRFFSFNARHVHPVDTRTRLLHVRSSIVMAIRQRATAFGSAPFNGDTMNRCASDALLTVWINRVARRVAACLPVSRQCNELFS
jgi:hypothetical protein